MFVVVNIGLFFILFGYGFSVRVSGYLWLVVYWEL